MASSQLTIGQELNGNHHKYTIVKVISDKGGQGIVYLAEDEKKNKWAIKWYRADEPKQRKRILDLYSNRSRLLPVIQLPECEFVWPLDILQTNESFGYAMNVLPETASYEDIKYDTERVKGKGIDFLKMSIISVNVCRGFDKLHSTGYCYKDISGGNIRFDVKTGNVYIIDCDNICPANDPESDVLGTAGFIAPEILRGETKPNKLTDRFSIAAMLFQLWCRNGPFEGTKAVLYEGDDIDKDVYSHPVFVFHPKDKSNTVEKDPDEDWAEGIFEVVRYCWKMIPEVLRQEFNSAFIDGADQPAARKPEGHWVQVFESLLNGNAFMECKKCHCYVTAGSHECFFCGARNPTAGSGTKGPGKPNPGGPVIEVLDGDKFSASIPMKLGDVISGAQLASRLAKMKTVMEICAKPDNPSLLAIRNKSIYNWTIYYKNSTEKRILPAEKAVAVRNVEKILLPCNITLIIK